MSWALLKWLGPLAVALALFSVVIWQRGDLIKTHSDLNAATTRITDLNNANASLNTALGKVKLARVDNDAIATAVAAKMSGIKTREVRTQTVIEKVNANDPQAAKCANASLPDSVRQALRAH